MTILPINPAAPDNATPAALLDFLEQCRALAVGIGRPRLVSITLEVPALDPLAVLESIFEPEERHFYVERPAENIALAGAEAVLAFSARGAQRFADCQRFIDATLADAIAVGDQTAAFSGPHFFTAFAFFDDVEGDGGMRGGDGGNDSGGGGSDAPFEPASVFVPRWQVALANGRTTAVANFVMPPDARADLRPLAEKVLRARQKFARFEYGVASEVARASSPCDDAQASPRSTGFQPVVRHASEQHGQDAHATQTHGLEARATLAARATPVPTLPPADSTAWVGNNSSDWRIRQGAHLPHWTRDGAIYAVTFRLADSLPRHVRDAWIQERDALRRAALYHGADKMTPGEIARLEKLLSEKIDALLDAGSGECQLRRPEIAALVRDAMLHFDGKRYVLDAWCVMPNHVHVILRPMAGHTLESILHSWKSYTSNKVNILLNRAGAFWQAEYYDHLIRDAAEYRHAWDYLWNNPAKAGLGNYWKWIGLGNGTGILPVPVSGHATGQHGQDAHATQTHGLEARATHYRAAVSPALDYIARGAFQKIVLARALDFTSGSDSDSASASATADSFHPLRILNTLRERFTDCHSFSLANGRGQSFIGASPERLLRVRARRLLTEALAGSAPRGASASEDAALGNALLHSEKDLREQRHVLDSILRRLEPLGLARGSSLTHPEHPSLRKLANVQHLHTPVEAALPDGVRLLDALARLHPTPAVGGTPREAAVAHIGELENFPRGLYAGAIGWIDSRGDGEFFVGLRSALIDGASARLYAGAGIVAGSSPDREFDETEIKFRAIRDALLC